MTRLPIRARLTAAFALAMAVVLAGTGVFVFLSVRANLDESVDASLGARAEAVSARLRSPAAGGGTRLGDVAGEADEGFAQIVAPGGRLVVSAGGARGPVLSRAAVARAERRPLVVERRIPGIEGRARILARPAAGGGGSVVVVGQSLEDRDDTLAGLVLSLAAGGAVAVLLASLVGYGLATAGLAPVEAMRRRAERLSLADTGNELPLPAARDEVFRLGATLNDMLERLRRSFERERRFVAEASHELRTPLAVQKTELETALRSRDCPPEIRRSLVAAIEECDHLTQLADDLLVLAQGSEGQLSVQREQLSVSQLLGGVRDRFVDRAAERGRTLRVEAGEELTMDADPLRLRQALGNLVDNALRHGGGTVHLTARAREEAAEIEVSDEGPGFPPPTAAQAFERFTRGDEARAARGAGLGLPLVRAIAQAHRGSAELVGPTGPGVRLRIPAASSAKTGEAGAAAAPRRAA